MYGYDKYCRSKKNILRKMISNIVANMTPTIYHPRYNIIIQKLKQKPASFKEIETYLQKCSLVYDASFKISQRTFQRDIINIRSLLHIEIVFDRKKNHYSVQLENGLPNEIQNRLLEIFDLQNLLSIDVNMNAKVIFENRALVNAETIYKLLTAIKSNQFIEAKYKKFSDEVLSNRILKPLAIKEFKNRWFLIAVDTKDDLLKTFGIDRISEVLIQNKKFEQFDAEMVNDRFNDYFGVIDSDSIKPEKVVLRFTKFQSDYVKKYPLHNSQKTIKETKNYCEIELFIKPTYDFMMEILSIGKEVKILRPKKLIDELKIKLQENLNQYI